MSSRPLVSIITINYNQTDITCQFLDSCKELTYNDIEIIVVDNHSKDNVELVIKANYPYVKFIQSESNLGFAGGNNLGIKAAKGKYLFIVNNDTEVTSNLLEPLVEVFETRHNVGAVSPKFRYYYHKDTIEYAGYKNVSDFTGRNNMIGCGEKDVGQYDELKQTNYVHGGGMMISQELIGKVGYIPEVFFLYYEEFDWCEKMKQNDLLIFYQPKSLIYHKESMTTGKKSLLKTYFISRNRILFMRRNRSYKKLIFFYSYLICISIPSNIIRYAIRGDFGHIRAYVKGLVWNMKNKKCVV